jgi:ribose-phosphate pyrophosphokinase
LIYLNGTLVNTTMFPDNTSQVWKIHDPGRAADIKWVYSHEGEFMQLVQLKYLIDTFRIPSSLELPYLPYGRQDKEVSNDATFALWAFAMQLNELMFHDVRICDPHSEKALDWINNARAYYPHEGFHLALTVCDPVAVCYPDAGAQDKYASIYKHDRGSMWADKSRDQSTGDITAMKLYGAKYAHRENVLIVDDICDGGATFVRLAKLLYGVGATGVDLFVTHGLFTKGLRPLRDAGIGRIFTKDGEATEPQRSQ